MSDGLRALDLAPEARSDIATLLAWSQADFGDAARHRYRLLIEAAFTDLRQDPDRPGVRPVPEIAPDLRLYPTRYSRTRLPTADRVRRPRHVVAFQADATVILVLRVLDERMDLPTRLREPPRGRLTRSSG